jgi:HAD superfamily hydrolase (TIGR01509 family)
MSRSGPSGFAGLDDLVRSRLPTALFPRGFPPLPTDSPKLLAIFDHDGVMVDSLAHHQEAWVELGERAGLPVTAAFIRETFGMANPSIFRRLVGEAITPAEIARYTELKETCYRDLARGKIELIPGVRDLLDRLTAAGFLLAVGTSGIRANLQLTIDEAGLEGRFASIASAEDFTHGKPDPEVFLVAARKAGVEPKHAVVFEDAVYGIQAAKAAGMRAIGVTTTNPAPALYEAGADLVVETLVGFDIEALARDLGRG